MSLRPRLGDAHPNIARARMAPGGRAKPWSQSPIPRTAARRLRSIGAASSLPWDLWQQFIVTDNSGAYFVESEVGDMGYQWGRVGLPYPPPAGTFASYDTGWYPYAAAVFDPARARTDTYVDDPPWFETLADKSTTMLTFGAAATQPWDSSIVNWGPTSPGDDPTFIQDQSAQGTSGTTQTTFSAYGTSSTIPGPGEITCSVISAIHANTITVPDGWRELARGQTGRCKWVIAVVDLWVPATHANKNWTIDWATAPGTGDQVNGVSILSRSFGIYNFNDGYPTPDWDSPFVWQSNVQVEAHDGQLGGTWLAPTAANMPTGIVVPQP